jgi:hypothetical protein
MGIRRGFIVGFLGGAAAASLLTKARRAEAPGVTEAGPPSAVPGSGPSAEASGLKGTLEGLRRRAEEAIEAAHEARTEKEAQMQHQFEEAKRKK